MGVWSLFFVWVDGKHTELFDCIGEEDDMFSDYYSLVSYKFLRHCMKRKAKTSRRKVDNSKRPRTA